MTELIEQGVDLPAFQVQAAIDRADLGSAADRDRVLDEVAPVLAATDPDSVSRQELVRRVADRLDTDAGLVTRRVEREGQGGRRAAQRKGGESPAPATRREPPAPLSSRERRERALIAMCIGSPAEGKEYLGRLTADHMSSPLSARALEWTRGHVDDPLAGLPRDDEELVSLVTQLVMASRRDPGSREAMELNFLQLEQVLLEDQLAAAQRGGGDPPVELQRRRNELTERIAHWDTAAIK